MNTFTFLDIFEKDISDGITIPRIQRDYAQGRETEKESNIRSRFLEDIFSIIAAEEEKTLEMDFVYGSIRRIQSGKEKRFIPLDGQQRLTTLYLLYWYVGNRELQGDELKELRSLLKKFSYEIRPSSSTFCEKLAEITPAFKETPETEIRNAAWFFGVFDHDPTVKSMLNMLDAIHQKYTEYTETGKPLYANLSRLRFYILPLDVFDLTDDLYIKMNARGKQLTDFEALKADLVKYITESGNPESDYYSKETQYDERTMSRHLAFSIKLDNAWTNFFWEYSRKYETPEDHQDKDIPVDKFFMNFFIRYFFNLFIIQSLSSEESPSVEKIQNKKLYYGEEGDDSKVTYQSFNIYKDILSESGKIKNMERVLDCLIEYEYYRDIIKKEAKAPWQDGHFSEDWDFFGPRINQSQRVIFLGITLFIEKNVAADNKLDKVQFARWMRVVRNIVENASINDVDSMIRAMRLIIELSFHSEDIYAFLAGDNNLDSKTAQVFEERAKAKLIVADETGQFERAIIDAENHRFFRGQIYFLLRISEGDINQFIYYRDRAKEVFTKDIEKSPCRFHRALAALVYKHPVDNRKDYYAVDVWNTDRLNAFKDEDAIRSAMLRHNENDFYYKLIKMLLDTDASETEFDTIIKSVPFDEAIWQTYLISSPHCFDYCQQKLIRKRSEEEIYLLKHSQMNHYHAELRTYYLYKEWMEKEFKDKDYFLPFTDCKYWESANGLEKPCAYLDKFTYHDFALDILYSSSGYELNFFSRKPDKEVAELLNEINSRAKLNMEFKKKGEDYGRDQLFSSGYKTMADVKRRIREICGLLKSL
jgi:hypothetical protein